MDFQGFFIEIKFKVLKRTVHLHFKFYILSDSNAPRVPVQNPKKSYIILMTMFPFLKIF